MRRTPFTCTGRGGIQRFEWIIDGVKYEGQGAQGKQLAFTFDQPGPHLVSVTAYSEKLVVHSDERTVNAIQQPTLAIVEPQDGKSFVYGQKITFVAQAEGLKDTLWTIAALNSKEPLLRVEKPVDATTGQSRIEYAFEEANKVTDAVVSVEGKLPAGLKLPAPTAKVNVKLVPPGRSVRIVKPEPGKRARFGEKVALSADVRGDVAKVTWTIRTVGAPDVALESQSVSREGGVGEAKAEHVFAEAPQDLEAVIVAEGKVSVAGVAPPRDEIKLKVSHSDLSARIVVENRAFKFNEPVPFKLECEGEAVNATWTFGDGATGEGLNPAHAYSRYGDFEVRAKVQGKGGRATEAVCLVHVAGGGLEARPKLLCGGKEIQRVVSGDTLELRDESSGDVTKREWLLDGTPLPEGQLSTVLEQPGEHKLTLRVTGPVGVDGKPAQDEKEVLIKVHAKPNHILFAAGLIVALVLFGVLFHLLSGNYPATWWLEYAETLERFKEGGTDRLAVAKYWDRWAKQAVIPVSRLFTSDHWTTGGGKDESFTVSASGDGISFSVEDQFNVARRPVRELESENRIATLYEARHAPEKDPNRSFVVALVKQPSSSAGAVVLKLVLFLALAGFVAWLGMKVYGG